MGRMPSRSTPCRLPQALALARSPHPVSFTFTLTRVSFTPSPSHCISVSPHLLHPRPRPFSHLPYHSPVSRHPLAVSPLRRLPSSHLFHPHPLSPSSSSLAAMTILLGPSPQERVSISFPPLLASPAPSSYLRGGSLFFSLPHPVTLQSLHHPLASRPRLRNCAGKIGKYYSTSYL